MKTFYFVGIIFMLFTNCKDTKNETYRDNIVPDISVNDIKLSDTTAVVLGYSDLKYNVIEGKEELPYAIFTNENKTEVLKTLSFLWNEKKRILSSRNKSI